MTKYIPGQNNFYVSARADSLVVGGWRPAIWLDQDLDRGKDNIMLYDMKYDLCGT